MGRHSPVARERCYGKVAFVTELAAKIDLRRAQIDGYTEVRPRSSSG